VTSFNRFVASVRLLIASRGWRPWSVACEATLVDLHQLEKFPQPRFLIALQMPGLGVPSTMAVASSQCPYTHARTNSLDAPVPGQCAEMMVPMTGANSKTICTFHLASGGLRTQMQIQASKFSLALRSPFLGESDYQRLEP
jgi:hypothetical protein